MQDVYSLSLHLLNTAILYNAAMEVNNSLNSIRVEYDQLNQMLGYNQVDDSLQVKVHQLALKLINFKESVTPKDLKDKSFKQELDFLSEGIARMERTISTGNPAVNVYTPNG